MIQFFHWYTAGESFLWNHAAEQADYLASLGISAAWLPPAYKGASGGASTGYDPYDLFDLGEFDQKGSVPTKYGSRKEFLNACKTLQDHGVSVIADIVLNHKGGGDELETFQVVKVDPEHRERGISEPYEIQAYTKFTFSARGGRYSEFEWNFTCFSGVDYAEGEGGGNIYRIINDYGDNWDRVISNEKGNFDFLMFNDIETRNPNVRAELNAWGKWFHDQCGFDGVRLDAVKHISPEFYKEWLQLLRSNTGKDIFAVGEFWAPGNLPLLEKYLGAVDHSMMLFDSALHLNLRNASDAGENYDLRTVLDHSLMLASPLYAVTLIANHDTQPLQALEAPVEPWFKPLAYALILLREEGYPCVFYPDLFGATYKDHGNDGGEYEIVLPKLDCLEALLLARKDHAYGEQYVYFDDPHCIGFTRHGDDEHPGCAVIMSNSSEASKRMEVSTRYAGQKFHDALGNSEQSVEIDDDGWADFPCPAGAVSVWTPAT